MSSKQPQDAGGRLATAIHFKDRWPSRGLHFHASTQNWLMIAGGRSESYNDRFVILTLETLTQIQAEQCGAHEAAYRGFLTCESVYWAAR